MAGGQEVPAAQGQVSDALDPEFVRERSHWGLFDRTSRAVRKSVDENGDAIGYKSLVYDCAGKPVEFHQPLEGVGTRLMHGDFARKLSPSEEALATFIIKKPRFFQGRTILVVGAGLGFAGLVCATCTCAASVTLTDGDPEVVRVLEVSTKLNEGSFEDTKVEVKRVLWDRMEDWPERKSFDLVIGADVVYLEELHSALISMIVRILKPGGQFLLFASRRNGSLANFCAASKAIFGNVEASTDYDADVARAIGRGAKCFPVMVKLVLVGSAEEEELPPSVVQMCEQLKERREQQLRQAAKEQRSEVRALAKRRALSNSLLERRGRRLEEEKERQAAEAAAAAAAEPAATPTKPRVSILSQAEAEGRSDWGLFVRHCETSETCKDMVFECQGRKVSLRRRAGVEFQFGEQARKISPCEEALATWVAACQKRFKKKRILEIGSGVGLAGLVAAVCTPAKHVELTDGDPSVVQMLAESIALNDGSAASSTVRASQLVWGEVLEANRFDWIIGADMCCQEDFSALLKTVRRMLKPSGTAVFIACDPGFQAFVTAASTLFDKVELLRDYNPDVTKSLQWMRRFPKMVQLRRTSVVPASKMGGKASSRRPSSRQRQPLMPLKEDNMPLPPVPSEELPGYDVHEEDAFDDDSEEAACGENDAMDGQESCIAQEEARKAEESAGQGDRAELTEFQLQQECAQSEMQKLNEAQPGQQLDQDDDPEMQEQKQQNRQEELQEPQEEEEQQQGEEEQVPKQQQQNQVQQSPRRYQQEQQEEQEQEQEKEQEKLDQQDVHEQHRLLLDLPLVSIEAEEEDVDDEQAALMEAALRRQIDRQERAAMLRRKVAAERWRQRAVEEAGSEPSSSRVPSSRGCRSEEAKPTAPSSFAIAAVGGSMLNLDAPTMPKQRGGYPLGSLPARRLGRPPPPQGGAMNCGARSGRLSAQGSNEDRGVSPVNQIQLSGHTVRPLIRRASSLPAARRAAAPSPKGR